MRILVFLIMTLSVVVQAQKKFTFESYENDPTGLRLYELENGLKVYLAQNQDEPKIQTYIAVRAGSVYDPADNTGLAHYLEHMLFKGTDQIGTTNWETEKVILDQVSDLFEKHKNSTNEEEKNLLYKQIDSLSFEASKLSIANEYDKMISSLGAEGTNAHTWHEETIYKNKIPANELEKWLDMESERFSQVVLRLFHTELETVYEEFNRSQDNDYRKRMYALNELLFPTHPYGQQRTIGTSEHLKNPSMEAIYAYFDKYYRPNNMAIILVGDLDFDETIALVDTYFGDMKPADIERPNLPKEAPMTEIVSREVFGPSAESVMFGYRTGGIGTKDEIMVTLCDMILSNSSAGLIDLNLNQKQKVQKAGCYPQFFNDYGVHTFYGIPREGQTLKEVEDLIIQQINNLKAGAFEDWMLEAVVNDMRLSSIRNLESATGVASKYYNAFIHFQDWQDRVNFLDALKNITKEEVVTFANEFYKSNYAVVYKQQGKNTEAVKVEKPEITPVELNRDKNSPYMQAFLDKPTQRLQPLFLDFDALINTETLESGIDFTFIENQANDLFSLTYILDMGANHIEKLPFAIEYSKLLGTDKYSAEELQKEFYKLGVNFGVSAGKKRSYVYISGLSDNMEAGLALFEHLLENIKPDNATYERYVESVLKGRADEMKEKRSIFWSGLYSLALYGENSALRNRLSGVALKNIQPQELTDLIKSLKKYKHEVFYYGKSPKQVKSLLAAHHQIPKTLMDYPAEKDYQIRDAANRVYFADYDMVQAEVAFVSKDVAFTKENLPYIEVFNSYFGGGLSSIVFQEIRESKSLAYSAYAYYSNPSEKDKPHLVRGYIGTQVDKLNLAVEALLELMNNIPRSDEQFLAAKESALKQLEAERITKSNVFWTYKSNQDLGLDTDYRKYIYETIKTMTFEDLEAFFDRHIKGKTFDFIVIGNQEEMDLKALEKLGAVQKVEIPFLFGETPTE